MASPNLGLVKIPHRVGRIILLCFAMVSANTVLLYREHTQLLTRVEHTRLQEISVLAPIAPPQSKRKQTCLTFTLVSRPRTLQGSTSHPQHHPQGHFHAPTLPTSSSLPLDGVCSAFVIAPHMCNLKQSTEPHHRQPRYRRVWFFSSSKPLTGEKWCGGPGDSFEPEVICWRRTEHHASEVLALQVSLVCPHHAPKGLLCPRPLSLCVRVVSYLSDQACGISRWLWRCGCGCCTAEPYRS